MDHFIKLFKKKKGKDIRKNNRSVQKLRREVEKAKRALSSAHQARIEIESFFDGEDFSETLTRAKFEELNMVSFLWIVRAVNWQHLSEFGPICFPVNVSDETASPKQRGCVMFTHFVELALQDLFRSTMKPVQKVLEDADLQKHEIDEIVLVGGSTRIPKIQQLVKEFFNGKVRVISRWLSKSKSKLNFPRE